jgi:hypothetical protein
MFLTTNGRIAGAQGYYGNSTALVCPARHVNARYVRLIGRSEKRVLVLRCAVLNQVKCGGCAQLQVSLAFIRCHPEHMYRRNIYVTWVQVSNVSTLRRPGPWVCTVTLKPVVQACVWDK